MTDTDEERKCFRPNYNKKTRSFNKEIPISADFRKKYKDCRLVLDLCVCLHVILCSVAFMLYCSHHTGVIAANDNTVCYHCQEAYSKGIIIVLNTRKH